LLKRRRETKVHYKRNLIWVLLFASFIAASVIITTPNVCASPAEIHVPTDYSTIQAAINAANPGDTIIVHDGTYTENLVINKILTIKAASHPIIDGGATGDCISVSANNVVIMGFEIRNGYNGITGETSGSTFADNIIHDNLNIPGYAGAGILLWGDNDNNVITRNKIYDNDRQGIFIGHSDIAKISTGNSITYNVIYNNGLYRYANGPDASEYGIQLWNGDNNLIERNEIYDHDDWFPSPGFDFAQGIYLFDSNGNEIKCNYLHDNNYGVGIWRPGRAAGANHINCNNIVGNTGYGVRTFDGPPSVDAENNFWGSASGPTHPSNPAGTGDKVSDNVDFDPWLRSWACPPVGGLWVPINKFELVAPWIGYASVIAVAAASLVYVNRRKKQQN
jgi:hypothetical protein